jgi:predicted nucleic acid-binding protein
MKAVVDASVAVEYLLRTELGIKVAGQLEAETLVAPELLDVEVLSVLRKAVRSRILDQKRAQEALLDLEAWQVERISHRKVWREAWALRANLTAYDAFYAAVAVVYDAILLTADGPLSRAPRVGIVIQNVRR